MHSSMEVSSCLYCCTRTLAVCHHSISTSTSNTVSTKWRLANDNKVLKTTNRKLQMTIGISCFPRLYDKFPKFKKASHPCNTLLIKLWVFWWRRIREKKQDGTNNTIKRTADPVHAAGRTKRASFSQEEMYFSHVVWRLAPVPTSSCSASKWVLILGIDVGVGHNPWTEKKTCLRSEGTKASSAPTFWKYFELKSEKEKHIATFSCLACELIFLPISTTIEPLCSSTFSHSSTSLSIHLSTLPVPVCFFPSCYLSILSVYQPVNLSLQLICLSV